MKTTAVVMENTKKETQEQKQNISLDQNNNKRNTISFNHLTGNSKY